MIYPMQFRRKSRLLSRIKENLNSAFIGGRTCKNIAKELDINRNTVALHFQKLRECLLKQVILESTRALCPVDFLLSESDSETAAMHSNIINSGLFSVGSIFTSNFNFVLYPFEPGWLKQQHPELIQYEYLPLSFGTKAKTITSSSVTKDPVIRNNENISNDLLLDFDAKQLNSEFALYISKYRGIALEKFVYYLVEFLFFQANPILITRRNRLNIAMQNWMTDPSISSTS